MKIFSTFSGIGGFEIGINNAYLVRHEKEQTQRSSDKHMPNTTSENGSWGQQRPVCVGYSEIDKFAIKVYEHQFKGVPNYGDITKINADELPDFDCLVGGFPCQAFSIAGKRKGFEDTRGTLFFDLARILRAKQPRLFVFENVKGLLSHDSGRTFKTIIEAIDELGYDCQWQVLNSKNHGVPQNRERVYIVGHLRGTPRPQVFPITGDGGADTRLSGHISNTLTARYEGAQAVGTYIGESKLDAQEVKIRRLTPLECERLQGFPDNWTAEGIDGAISDTQRYKMCGNAVTTNVVQAVFERILL
jgi:DNA (cytosine-5)-methyltransferase 1